MAIGEDGRSKRLLLLLFFLAYFLAFSLLLSILSLLRRDFLMISNVSILALFGLPLGSPLFVVVI